MNFKKFGSHRNIFERIICSEFVNGFVFKDRSDKSPGTPNNVPFENLSSLYDLSS